MNRTYTPTLVIAGMILAVAMVRLLSLPFPNFAPIAAMALFGGAYMSDKRLAFIIPLGAMLITDAIIGFHSIMPFVYGAFMLTGMIGLMLRNRVNTKNLVVAGVSSAILFFLITNFGVWAMYPGPKNLATLLVTYELGLPFLRFSLLGDLFFISVLFGGYALLRKQVPALANA